jgi:1-acyl-sn-glycerol-3-phosphate acyltransferase
MEPDLTAAPSATDHETRLLALVRSLARELRQGAGDFERLGLDHALERDFGLDSLARVELLTRIQRELGVQLAEEAFASAETPRDLLEQMRIATGAESVAPSVEQPTPVTRLDHPPQDIGTLTAILDWHVAHHGDWVHITLYGEGERSQDISYRALQQDALTLAAGLLAQGLGGGDRVAIMLPTGREFFASFYGVIYAGCVPVPLYPPARPSQLEDHMRRMAGIVANAGAVLLIADSRARILGHLLRAQCEALHDVTTVEELSVHGTLPALPKVKSQDTAFLQYTSGSTGNPKGVILSHANLLANLRAMESASGVTAADVFVSWLPLYHDMGLIGACMGSLYVGFRLVLLSPLAFLARPSRWLWTIHRHRATISAAPNFAYEICANKVDDRELEGLTLDSWRIAYNGAEPVSPDTIEHFAARFARFGFRREAMTPVYGLAESSVGLAFPPSGRGPLIDYVDRSGLADEGNARPAEALDAHAQRIVCCGRALPDHDIRIVDAAGNMLPERMTGRVQFRGPSATSGYFGNPSATTRLFDGSWLNTGDLGYLASGELYLTGREKDIIIRGGHNIYPQELEEAVGRLNGVRKGGVAVFPATDPRSATERLVVLAETREDNPTESNRLLAEINGLAIDLVGMPADDIVLAPPRTVLKTSSGKVRRAACRELYEGGALSGAQRAPLLQVLRLGLSSAGSEAMRLLLQGIDGLWAAWAWLIYLAIVPLAWVLIVMAPTLSLRRYIARLCARLALALTGLTPKVEGLQHLADETPCIVVANHASYLDALILTAVLPPRFAYVAKQELLAKPAAGIPLRRLGSAFVERFESARGVEDTRMLEERLRSGDSLMFFAEGTFRSAPGLLPLRMGAFTIAASSAMPVVPLTLTGTRTLLRGEEHWPHFSRLRVQVGQPLMTKGNDWQAALRLRDAARSWILERVKEPDAGA